MRILVLGGAGFIGSEAVKDLVKTSDFSEIVVGDIDLEKAKKFVAELKDERVSAIKIDVRNEKELVNTLKEFDIVASTLPFKYDIFVTKAAIKAGINGLDVAQEEDQFALDEEAKKAGITYIAGLGATPGITNVLSRYGVDRLDTVYKIEIAFAPFRCVAPAPGLLYTTLWEADPQVKERLIYQDGEFIRVPPLSHPKIVDFPEPIGRLEAYVMPHEETRTLPKYIKGLKTVIVRGAWPPKIQNLLKFIKNFNVLKDEKIKVGDALVSPREFIYEFLLQAPEAKEQDLWGYALYIEVYGFKEGREIKLTYRVSHPTTGEWAGKVAYPKFVASPLSIGAQLLAHGKIKEKGVLPPEACVPTEEFINELVKRGYIIEEKTEGHYKF